MGELDGSDLLFTLKGNDVDNLLILQAQSSCVPAPTQKPDYSLEVRTLWNLHVNLLAATLVNDPKVRNKGELIKEKWRSLTDVEAKSLIRQKGQIGEISNDPIALRAFCILYHQHFVDVDLPGSSESSIKADAYMESVLRKWKKQKHHEKIVLWTEARSQLKTLAVPIAPGQSSTVAILERNLSALETNEQQLDEAIEGDATMTAAQHLATLEVESEDYSNLLGTIEARMRAVSVTDKQRSWLAQLTRIRRQKTESHTKIGFVGSTGSGKSSIINALIGEAKLVPTSCWRACTAVAIEIAYNHSTRNPYRGEVRFITKQDWEAELEMLSSDLPENGGTISQDSDSRSTEASIALAKIAVVCPDINTSRISKSTVRKLMKHPNVVNRLGTTVAFTADTAEEFSGILEKYVDSNNLDEENDIQPEATKSGDASNSQEAALWPIVESFRLFTKAPILRDGVSLLDLPGVHDSNRARAQVARDKLKTCSHLFIVTPMTRAVDDKSANDLLSDSFKRQMKLDGTYDTATIIASQSDSIDFSAENARSLGISTQIASLEHEKAELAVQIARMDKQVREVYASHAKEEGRSNELSDAGRVYHELWKQVRNSTRTVPEPPQIGQKRKYDGAGDDSMSRKKRDAGKNPLDSDYEESEDEAEPPSRMLNAEALREKMDDLKAERKNRLSTMESLHSEGEALEAELKLLRAAQEKYNGEDWRMCVAARNDRTRRTMKKKFAESFKEYDQELAAQSTDIDPDACIRDYDKVAEQLPVFCVSSKGYKRLKHSPASSGCQDGFSNIEQTEIPALFSHVVQLSESSRRRLLIRFITRAGLLTTTMKMWAIGTGLGSNLSKNQIAERRVTLKESLKVLRKVCLF